MGAERSVLSDIQIDQECYNADDKICSIHSAKQKKGSKVTVFLYRNSSSTEDAEYVANSVQRLLVLRHPSILRYVASGTHSKKYFLVTEHISPLSEVIDNLCSTEIIAGLYNIIKAIHFIHTKGGICHNNLNFESIFVADDGDWKLGAFEYSCHFKDASLNYLEKCRPHRHKDGIPPEEINGKLSPANVYARDIYAFGVFCEKIFPFLSEMGNKIKSLQDTVREFCLNEDPDMRLHIEFLLSNEVFKCDFIEIKTFLSNITLKSYSEKKLFFVNLVPKLLTLPCNIVATSLIRPLLCRFVLIEKYAQEYLLPSLLTPSRSEHSKCDVMPILPENLFRQHVAVEIFKIFHVRDANVRMVLLKFFSSFVKYIDHNILINFILPQILLGIRDTNDDLVCLSLQALAHLVPILGGDVVIGAHRSKLFKSGYPIISGETCKELTKARESIVSEVISSNRHFDESSVEKNNKNYDLQSSSEANALKKKTLKEIASAANLHQRKEESLVRSNERRKMYDVTKTEICSQKTLNEPEDCSPEIETNFTISNLFETRNENYQPNQSDENIISDKSESSRTIYEVSSSDTKSEHRDISPNFSQFDSWNTEWEANEVCLTSEIKNPNTPLGSEYDIKPIDQKIEDTSNEMNFFADMEPIISKKMTFLETLAVSSKIDEFSSENIRSCFVYNTEYEEDNDSEYGQGWNDCFD